MGILVLTVAGGAFYLGRSTIQKSSPNPVDTSQTPQSVPDSTPIISRVPWRTYTIKSLGLTYDLPPEVTSLGELQEFIVPGQIGTQIFISTENSKVVSDKRFLMGTTSVDYMAGRGGMFIDLQGFKKENGKYYAKFVHNQTIELSNDLVNEVKNSNGLDVIKIKGRNYDSGEAQGIPVTGTPGQGKIGALININKPPYQGLAVQMDLTQNLTEQLFDRILSTFKSL